MEPIPTLQPGVDVAARGRARDRVSMVAHVVVPLAVVAAVLVFVLAGRLAGYGGNPTGFVQFGSAFAGAVHPPAGALIDSPAGYDGQFFYLQARDPLLLHDATVAGTRLADEGFRLQRVGYPALAWLLAGGRTAAIPVSLLAVNVIVLLMIAAAGGAYAHRHGRSGLWAVAAALMPGMLLPAQRDLSDPLATAAVLAGVLLWRSRRRWPATLALTVAVLTREVMMVVVAAVVVDGVLRAWQVRAQAGAARSILAGAWPVAAIPTVMFAAWHLYATARYGGSLGSAPADVPMLNLLQEVRWSLRSGAAYGGWDLAYVALVVAAVAAAVASLLHRVTLISLATCAVALGVLIPRMGDLWSDTRLAAPLFALLLVDGLHRRHRPSIAIASAAAAMSLLLPVLIPGLI
jgi:hypothetical protein